MEIEKKIWDMRSKDYLTAFLRFWLIIALVSTLAGGAFFVFGYYDKIVNENYTSKIEYQFLYVVDTPSSDTNSTGKLADPSIYVNVYRKWYSDLDVLKSVESALEKNMEKEMHYKAVDIKRETEIVYLNFNLTISVTTKRAEHSQEILKLIKQFAQPKINDEIQRIKDRDPSGDIEINDIISEPGLGINYESEEEVLMRLVLNFALTFLGIFLVLYAAAIVFINFDGRFKSHNVFENNFQIPVLGEVSIKLFKE